MNHPTRTRSGQAGVTLIEVTIVLVIMTFALGAMTATMGSIGRLVPTSRDTALAVDAARGVIEDMRETPFDELFARYNQDPGDDPPGPLPSPGADFAVPGLDTAPDDPDGFVGTVILPTVGGQVREDIADARRGMPRDLDGDGAIDAADHAADYEILPVQIRLEWAGKGRKRSYDVFTMIARP